jgi:hypothetical protein
MSKQATAPHTPTPLQLAEQAGHAEGLAVLRAICLGHNGQPHQHPIALLCSLFADIAYTPSDTRHAYAAGVAVALHAVLLRGMATGNSQRLPGLPKA